MSDRRQTRRKARLLPLLPGLCMLCVLAGGLVLTATNPAVFTPPGRISVLAGRWAARYGEHYEGQLAVRPFAAALWDLLRYALFAEGGRGVLVGRDGWLFTTEEFEVVRLDEAPAVPYLELVGDVHRALAARGVALVVALVPAKTSIYPEHLGRRYTVPARFEGRYASLRARLSAMGVQAPNLEGPLREARTRQAVFLRTDTHWTPAGARAAAEALAPFIVPELEGRGSPRTAFVGTAGDEQAYRGDLLSFIRLGQWFERFGPPPDTLTRTRAVLDETQGTEGEKVGLFDDIVIPVVLVGTSYSAGPLWGFDDALKVALQADVLNVAEEGRGPFLPMQALLEGSVLADVRPDVVVWEIPERYFEAPPGLNKSGGAPP